MKTDEIYAFAFQKRNISCSTLYRLKDVDHRYLLWGEKTFEKYIELLLHDQPRYILGLGVFYGNCDGKIRIETKCSNLFKCKYKDSDRLVEFEINPFMKPHKNSKFTDKIGNFYCNLISWKIMSKIRSGDLKSRYTFLHIPRKMKLFDAVREVDKMFGRIVNKPLTHDLTVGVLG